MSTISQANGSPLHAERAQRAGRGPIHVMVVDDHAAVRVGVATLIDDKPDMRVVGTAASAEEALGKLELRPDVLVLDYHLGGGHSGLWLTHRVSALKGPLSVLIYSAFADEVLAAAAIVAGAEGLLDKRSLGEELCNGVRDLAHGRRSLPAISRSTIQVLGSQLGPRDEAAFGMLMHGVEPEEILTRMGMSAGDLATSRSRTLLALAPKLDRSAAGRRQQAPLDYGTIRNRHRGNRAA